MNGKLVRFVAGIAIGALVAVGGVVSTAHADEPGQGGSGSTSTMAAKAAEQIQRVYIDLDEATKAKDVAAVEHALDQLRPALTLVKSAGVDERAYELSGTADSQAAEVQRMLLPGLPDPLSMVTGLLTSLLATLMSLITGLLGGLPLPVPLPPLPGVPPLPVPIPTP